MMCNPEDDSIQDSYAIRHSPFAINQVHKL